MVIIWLIAIDNDYDLDLRNH